jgi:hypothetical protein
MNEASSAEHCKPGRIWSEIFLHSVITSSAEAINLTGLLD